MHLIFIDRSNFSSFIMEIKKKKHQIMVKVYEFSFNYYLVFLVFDDKISYNFNIAILPFPFIIKLI